MTFKALGLDEITTREEDLQMEEVMVIQLATFSELLPRAKP